MGDEYIVQHINGQKPEEETEAILSQVTGGRISSNGLATMTGTVAGGGLGLGLSAHYSHGAKPSDQIGTMGLCTVLGAGSGAILGNGAAKAGKWIVSRARQTPTPAVDAAG